MFNSIIVAYRRRPELLKTFFRSIYLSSLSVAKSSFEIVITDLDSSPSPAKEIVKYYNNKFTINYHKTAYDRTFWKSKTLNSCAARTCGEYITMLDVDSVVTPDFLKSIEDFYDGPYKRIKLAHRVREIPDDKGKYLLNNEEFSADWIYDNLVKNAENIRLARERFFVTNKLYKEVDHKSHPDDDLFNNYALGNSHYTMMKSDFMAIGGYDERFKGWGLEDMDFNVRAFHHLKVGRMRTDPRYTVYHIKHIHEKTWKDKQFLEKNRKFYRSNFAAKAVNVSPVGTWGVF